MFCVRPPHSGNTDTVARRVMMNNKVYIFLADGFEDIEALATRDILLRASFDVKTVSINDCPEATSARGLKVSADLTLDALLLLLKGAPLTKDDMLVFPGGLPGAANLGSCSRLIELMKSHYALGGSLAAICAAPAFVLAHLDNLQGLRFTCYDGCQGPLCTRGAVFERKPSVCSRRIITGRGPGHTFDFALSIVSLLAGEQAARDVALGLTLQCD